MRNILIFLDMVLLSKIEKINPRLYFFIRFDLYKKYCVAINYIKHRDPFYFQSVNVGISTYCNRKCDYCPNKNYETPKKFMKEELFYNIVEQLKEIKYDGSFQYSLYNEPLFDERLPKFVDYVRKQLPKAIQILVTNGDILTMEKAISLSNLGIDKFIVTIHDKNPDKGLKKLSPIKKALKGKMNLQISSDLDIVNRGGAIDNTKYKHSRKNKICEGLRGPFITEDGDMVLCCNDYFRTHIMGNVKGSSIIDIWNSDKYKEIRKDLFITKQPKLSICKKCLEINEK